MDECVSDDLGTAGVSWVPLPAAMADDLRLRLEAE
jgi:hypothetical protein